jgi:hypothetical protein
MHSPGWPDAHDLLPSASQVLTLQVYATASGKILNFYKTFLEIIFQTLPSPKTQSSKMHTLHLASPSPSTSHACSVLASPFSAGYFHPGQHQLLFCPFGCILSLLCTALF